MDTPKIFIVILPLIAVAVLLVLAVLAKIYFRPWLENLAGKTRDERGAKGPLPYFKRRSIVTDNELKFFKALQAATQNNWHIFTKVRLEDIIGVKDGLERKEAYGFRSRIKSRHIDFVLCDKENLEILMCIEVDDRSHQRKDRQERDAFVDQALADAGVELVRIPAQMNYAAEYVRGYIIDDTPEPKSKRHTSGDDRRFMPQS